MIDPASLTAAIDNANKVANTPLFTTIIDKITGFKISQWAAEGEVRKKMIHDEYEKAKENGIMGIQYIENLRHTTNLIDTAVKSSKYIDENKTNDIKIDNDFFWNTLEYAKTISDEEMQELIAKIIAGEFNQSGTYSISTLQVVKMLGKNELELFEKICSLCINKFQIPKAIFSSSKKGEKILRSLSCHYGVFQELQNLGLFLPNVMTTKWDNPEKQDLTVTYFDKNIKFKVLNEKHVTFSIPSYFELSNSGKQIFNLLNPVYNQDYYNWLIENYKILNYYISEN